MRNNKTVHAIVIAALLGATALTTANIPDAGPAAVVSAVAPMTEHGAGEDSRSPMIPTESEWDLPNIDHHRVDYWVEQFTTAKRDDFAIFLTRMQKYDDMILSKLEEREMPADLIYLAMIESGFNPLARSSAKAVGLWQFIADTGRRYGLDVNSRVDERRDPVKSTEAALSYLSDLYDRFGSWYLAAAAYNTGENRVGRIMRTRTGSEKAQDESAYYRIWDHLPRETRDYVPLMIAAARISKEPAKYGFDDVLSQKETS
jgi:membrane-bound lytic murein transglycosylase D